MVQGSAECVREDQPVGVRPAAAGRQAIARLLEAGELQRGERQVVPEAAGSSRGWCSTWATSSCRSGMRLLAAPITALWGG